MVAVDIRLKLGMELRWEKGNDFHFARMHIHRKELIKNENYTFVSYQLGL